MKKLINILLAASLLLMLTACSEHLIVPDKDAQQIGFNPVTNMMTKAPVNGSVLPDDMPLYVSAYFNPSAGQTDPAGPYFTGVEFVKDPSHARWYTEIPRYWPIGGSLNFLAYATYSNNSTATPSGIVSAAWGTPNNTTSVVLTVGNNHGVRDDLLYGAANNQHFNPNGNPVVFSHANALVVFRLAITDSGDNYNSIVADAHSRTNVDKNVGLKIDSIKINNVSYGGTFTVTNDIANGSVTGAWSNLTNLEAASFVYDTTAGAHKFSPDTLREWRSGVNTYADTKSTEPFGDAYVVLPQQARTSFTIFYTIHNGLDANGGELKQSLTYTHECNDPSSPVYWEKGNKYVYEIVFTMHKITIAPEVTPWHEDNTTYEKIEIHPGATQNP